MVKGLTWAATLTILSIVGTWALASPLAPDPVVTYGDLCHPEDKDFKEYRYDERIAYCERNVSWYTRDKIYNGYAIPTECRNHYTIDHFIPLSVGGSNHEANLWPEHKNIKAARQSLEMNTYRELRAGRITQVEAIDRITEAKMNPPNSIVANCD